MADGSKISGLYLGLIFASIAIIGVSIFQADLMSHYGVSDNGTGYMNKSAEISTQVGTLVNSLNTTITGIAPLDAFINSIFSATKLFFGVGDIYTSFIWELNSILHIPPEIITLIIIAIIALIVFSIFSIITDRRI